MRKTIILLIFATIYFMACEDKVESVPDTFELNASNLTFTSAAGHQCISLISNTKWTTSVSDSWIECNPSEGSGDYGCVKIITVENTTHENRTGSVIFKANDDLTRILEVLQEREQYYINVQPVAHQAIVDGEELNIVVTTNGSWGMLIPTEAQSWVALKSKSENGAVINISSNDTENDRSCEIIFSINNHDLEVPMTLSQKKLSLEIDPTSKTILSDKSDFSVNVNSSVSWIVDIPAQDQWVSVKSKTTSSVTFSVMENDDGTDRSSDITFSREDGSMITMFKLTQSKGYVLMSTMEAEQSMVGKNYNDINSFMKTFGFDYSEHPNCTGGYGGHIDGVHCDIVMDSELNKYVFRFDVHIDPVIDGDRCSSGTVDRQRNEMKSITNNSTWAKVQGNWDEWQVLEWKFKIPKNFQPTGSFCHIHQLKAQDGPNNGSPIITITPRANSNGTNKRMQIIHSVDGASTGKGTIVDNIPLSDFEDEWVQVRQEMHYTHNGYYSCEITRLSDGKVLIDFKDTNIDMWRSGSSFVRSKYGIYRSLAGGRLDQKPVGQSSLLKNESIWITGFKVYERNSNPNPGLPWD